MRTAHARLLYFDRQYNDTLGLLHEDAHDDSIVLQLEGTDPKIVEVRLLSPLDLAVSKIGRLSDQDRDDIAVLARRGLVTSTALRRRAEQAAGGYVGDLERVAQLDRYRLPYCRGRGAARQTASPLGPSRDLPTARTPGGRRIRSTGNDIV